MFSISDERTDYRAVFCTSGSTVKTGSTVEFPVRLFFQPTLARDNGQRTILLPVGARWVLVGPLLGPVWAVGSYSVFWILYSASWTSGFQIQILKINQIYQMCTVVQSKSVRAAAVENSIETAVTISSSIGGHYQNTVSYYR